MTLKQTEISTPILILDTLIPIFVGHASRLENLLRRDASMDRAFAKNTSNSERVLRQKEECG